MYKKAIPFFSAAMYELLRGLYILTAQPENSIQFLPASWYVAVPLLCIPALLFMLAAFLPQQRLFILQLLIVVKLTELPGILVYICIGIQYFAIYGILDQRYSGLLLFLLLAIFLIDGILICVLFVTIRHWNTGKNCTLNSPETGEPD
jgi:hypothetical protein